MSYWSDLNYAGSLLRIAQFFKNNTEYLDYRGAYTSSTSINVDIVGIGDEYKYGSNDYDLEYKYLTIDRGLYYIITKEGTWEEYTEQQVRGINSEEKYFQMSTLHSYDTLKAMVVFNTFLEANFNDPLFIDLDYLDELNLIVNNDGGKE